MKLLKTTAIITPIILALLAFTIPSSKQLAIGDKAPKSDWAMMDISGKSLSLDQLKKEKGLLVIFSCNTCPFVIAWEDRYPKLGEICAQNNVGMVLVNSNEAKREGADAFDKMQLHAQEKNYNCNYVVDNNSELANAFGARTTPHVYLFNGAMELVYRGAIDDNYKNAHKVNHTYLQDALTALAEEQTIAPSITKAAGCSIKRKH